VNDTFSFHAPAEVLRRRVDPRWVRLGVVVTVATLAIGAFAGWVVSSEHAADRRREAALAALDRPAASAAPSPAVFDDDAARAAASTALTAARDVFSETGSFAEASTALLAAEQPELIFVDGPSAAPAIVSVDARSRSWSAAVMGEAGSCFWVKATDDGVIRYGRGSVCTGEAAAAADRMAW
jgi:hypothetical protein